QKFVEGVIKVLSPVAPHLCEEIWSKLGYKQSISQEPWPEYDESKLVEEEVEVAIQVMGRVRERIHVSADISKEELEKHALENETIQEWIEGKTVRKVIVVPGKLVNIVAN